MTEFDAALAQLKDAQAKYNDLLANPPSSGRDGKDGAPGRDGKDADMASLQKFIAAEIAKIKVIPGPAGLDGKPGPQGPAGKDADPALIANLQAQIDALRSQRFTAELYDASGSLVQSVPFGADTPLKLKLVPLK